MAQLRASMIIDLAGNLASRANQYLGSMQRLGQGGSRSMQVLQRSIHAAGQGIDRLGNRYTAILSGAAGFGAVKQVGDLSERLTYLGIQAQKPRAEIQGLYRDILDAAQAPDIRVDPAGILAGVEVIVEKLGDLDLARKNLKNIGLVMRATGADGAAAGDMIANMKEKFNLKDDQILPALDTLVLQGKAGAFTLKDMVTQGNRVTAAYGAMGRKGPQAVRELGAALQVFRKSSGSAEETSTAFKNFFSDLMAPEHQKILKANGIKIWDEKALKEGRKEIRSIVNITDQLLAKSKGDPEKLGRLLGQQTMDGFKAVLSGYQSTGKNPMYEYLDVHGEGAELMRDSARAAQELNASVQQLYTSWQRFAAGNLTEPIRGLANVLNSVEPGTVQRWLQVAGHVTAVVGGLILARKAMGGFQWVKENILTGGKGKGGAPGAGGLGGGGGVVPVYVVNKDIAAGQGGWQIPGSGGTPPGGGTPTPGRVGKLAKLGRVAGAVTQVGGAATIGYAVGEVLNEIMGAGIGLVSGGKYKGPGAIGEIIYDALHGAQAKTTFNQTQVGGEIRVKIESDRPATVTKLETKNDKVPIAVSSGLTMRTN